MISPITNPSYKVAKAWPSRAESLEFEKEISLVQSPKPTGVKAFDTPFCGV
jgi:hypothetical protein